MMMMTTMIMMTDYSLHTSLSQNSQHQALWIENHVNPPDAAKTHPPEEYSMNAFSIF